MLRRTENPDQTSFPWASWDAYPSGIVEVGRLYGIACLQYIALLCDIEREAWRGKRAAELPSDRELVDKLRVSRQTLTTVRKEIEVSKLVEFAANSFRIAVEPLRNLRKVERSRKPGSRWELDEHGQAIRDEQGKPKCRVRTKPQPVMVRIPGSLHEVPIDVACAAHGGKGHECACPLHRISEETIVTTKATYEDSCKVDFPKPSPGLRPPNPPPKASAATLPAESGNPESSVSQVPVPSEAQFSIEDLRSRLNQKLRLKMGSNVREDVLRDVYAQVHTELGWRMLLTQIDATWAKCKRWRFIVWLAADAGPAAREERSSPSTIDKSEARRQARAEIEAMWEKMQKDKRK